MSDFDDSMFVSAAAIPRDIKLPDGRKHRLYFKELTFADLRRFTNAEVSDDPEIRANSVPHLLVAGVCGPDGQPVLTFERASALKSKVTKQMAEIILELGGLGKSAATMDAEASAVGNESPPGVRSGSGAPSPSPLVAEALPSGSSE